MEISYSPKFAKEYKKLSNSIKLKAEKKEKLFRQNPFNKSLKTHKLGGKLQGFWAFSIDYKYRIIFEFIKDDKITFHLVGSHSIYKN